MISGGCLCGRVRYEADGEPLFGVVCHCRDCQRASGVGHVPVLGFRKSQFKVSGETTSFSTLGLSGRAAVRHFCAHCGSMLYGLPEVAPDLVTLYAGSLDDPRDFKPDYVQFLRDRRDWDRMTWDAPGHHLAGQ
jgi:hypothetical protein